MPRDEGDRETIETVCPSCLERQRRALDPSMKGVVVSVVRMSGRPFAFTVLFQLAGELKAKGQGATEDEAYHDACEQFAKARAPQPICSDGPCRAPETGECAEKGCLVDRLMAFDATGTERQ